MADETSSAQSDTPEEETAGRHAETANAEEPASSTTTAVDPAPETGGKGASPESEEPLFEAEELKQFDADDVQAGSAICKMLSLFFFYTVIVMAVAGYWTYSVLFQ